MDRRILVADGYISEVGCCMSAGILNIEAIDDEESEEDGPVPEVQAIHCCMNELSRTVVVLEDVQTKVESLGTKCPVIIANYYLSQERKKKDLFCM